MTMIMLICLHSPDFVDLVAGKIIYFRFHARSFTRMRVFDLVDEIILSDINLPLHVKLP